MSCLQNLYIADMSATGGYPVNIGCVLLTASSRLPSMGSPFSVGYDLFSNRPVTIDAYGRCLISTGVCLDIPCGFYGCIYPRSSLVLYSNVTMIPYCLDADARYFRVLFLPPTCGFNSQPFAGGRLKSWWLTIRLHHTMSLLLTPLGRSWFSLTWQPHFERFLRSRKRCVAPWVLNAQSNMLQAPHHWFLWAPTVSSVTYFPGDLM